MCTSGEIDLRQVSRIVTNLFVFRCFVVVVVVVVGGEFHVQVVDMNTNYSFEVFVCLAVLKEYKNELLKSSEISSVYNTIHR